jgi:hypothetical protein
MYWRRVLRRYGVLRGLIPNTPSTPNEPLEDQPSPREPGRRECVLRPHLVRGREDDSNYYLVFSDVSVMFARARPTGSDSR